MEPSSDVRERGHSGGSGFRAAAWTRMDNSHTSYRDYYNRINAAPRKSSQQLRIENYRDKDGNSLSKSPYALTPDVMRYLYPKWNPKARFLLDGLCNFGFNPCVIILSLRQFSTI